MAFTEVQVRQLKAKLDSKHVKTRCFGGATLHYIEGWHAIAEANRIFGFDGWDRETLTSICISNTKLRGEHVVAYTAKVRVTVRAGDTVVVREGSGTGDAKDWSPGQAHELALKSAETDATKRALASFGNPFGLALYDPEHCGVKKSSNGRKFSQGKDKDSGIAGPWALRSSTGETFSSFAVPNAFAEALRKVLKEATTVEELFGIWEHNVGTVRLLHRLYRRHLGRDGTDGIQLVLHLKACSRRLAGSDTGSNKAAQPRAEPSAPAAATIDKSVLTISEPKRIRSKEHLRFVAQQPCLICGRTPSHAHHIRYAQPRGLALKVSDEFTVPLCAIHHAENHRTGKERRWWEERKIDPLAVAAQLWGQRKENSPT
jgi:DNA recombination protein Rad52